MKCGEGLRRRRSSTQGGSTGTASTPTRRRTALEEPDEDRRSTARGRERPGTEMRTIIPSPVSLTTGMPNTALVGVRGAQDELRRHRRHHHRPGEAPVPRVRPRLRQRLVRDRPTRCRPGPSPTFAGCAVTNTFGERLWVEPAGGGARGGLAALEHVHDRASSEGKAEADTTLLLLPTAPKVERGASRRGRDADPRRGGEHGLGDRDDGAAGRRGEPSRVWRPAARRELTSNARCGRRRPRRRNPCRRGIRYEVMSTVPENWIPFIPAHDAGRNRDRPTPARGAAPGARRRSRPIPSASSRGPCCCATARTPPAEHPYFIHEEEVPRDGAQVIQAFQRTRWSNGRAGRTGLEPLCDEWRGRRGSNPRPQA